MTHEQSIRLGRKSAKKENVMSKTGFGHVATNGSRIKNDGEKRIVGHTEAGDGVSMKIQSADVKKALGSVHKMDLGGNAVALDGNKSYAQNKESGRKTRTEYEGGQCVVYLWAPSDRRMKDEEESKMLKGSKLAILATENEETKKCFARRV